MKAHDEGAKIECRSKSDHGTQFQQRWEECNDPKWDWDCCEYRVVDTKKVMINALDQFIAKGLLLQCDWDDNVDCTYYPEYLPSFDEFMADMIGFRSEIDRG